MNIETILVPTDFSKDADSAVAHATALAQRLGAKIVVLHAQQLDLPMFGPYGEGGYMLPAEFRADARREAKKQVDAVVARVRGEGVAAEGELRDLPAAEAIIDSAGTGDVDLVVMGTRGHTGLKHVLMGSVAERVVRLAACPVMTVKAEAATTRAEGAAATS